MNVSFTRARSKLVLFGSRKTLQREPLLAQFFALMEEQGWIFQLPPGSESVHAKAFETTVVTPAQPSKQATIKTGQKRRHTGKENVAVKMEQSNQRKEIPPPAKKARLEKKVNGDARTGLLNGRPILQDLVVNEM
jgi:DNA replication ATP-dependent helicase Dna2